MTETVGKTFESDATMPEKDRPTCRKLEKMSKNTRFFLDLPCMFSVAFSFYFLFI